MVIVQKKQPKLGVIIFFSHLYKYDDYLQVLLPGPTLHRVTIIVIRFWIIEKHYIALIGFIKLTMELSSIVSKLITVT